jgi:cytoplasmic iron level regulating protein YaaA (DUF328/UPF0246 family)
MSLRSSDAMEAAMYILLSPAKKLRDPISRPGLHSTAALAKDAEMLSRSTRQLSDKKLKELMGLSDNLASLNQGRFQAIEFPHNPENSSPAALTFNGDVYLGLDAPSLSEDDLEWAQDRLGILSGLYGILRPLDLIQPYRLEMGTSLKTRRGPNLYRFWGKRIAKEINARTGVHDHSCIINLASNEYFKAASVKDLEAPIITPAFKEIRDGKPKIISFFAKRARGMMTRYIIENRIEDPEALKLFNTEGYSFRPALSHEKQWVFARESQS